MRFPAIRYLLPNSHLSHRFGLSSALARDTNDMSDFPFELPITENDKPLSKLQYEAIGRAHHERAIAHKKPMVADCRTCGTQGAEFHYGAAMCDQCLLRNGLIPRDGLRGFMRQFYPIIFWNAVAEGATDDDLRRVAEFVPSFASHYVSDRKNTARPLRDLKNNGLGDECRADDCTHLVPQHTTYKHYCSHACYVRQYRRNKRANPVREVLVRPEGRGHSLVFTLEKAEHGMTVKQLCEAARVKKAFAVKAIEPAVSAELKKLVNAGTIFRYHKGSTTGKPEYIYTFHLNEARDNFAFFEANRRWGNKLPNGMAWT